MSFGTCLELVASYLEAVNTTQQRPILMTQFAANLSNSQLEASYLSDAQELNEG